MFSIVIPIYNEEKNIEPLIKEIYDNLNNLYRFELIIVDDCSDDQTLSKIKKFKNNNNFKIIQNKVNSGQSYSLLNGIKNSTFKIITTIDGDGQNNPSDIPKLIREYQSDINVFLVGGIRNNRKDSIVKILSSKIANLVRSKILHDKCKDTGCSLKVFDKDVFLKFPFFDGIHRFLPALFLGYGYKTKFINVDHRKRKYGYSKYGTYKRLIGGIKDIFKVKAIIKKQKK